METNCLPAHAGGKGNQSKLVSVAELEAAETTKVLDGMIFFSQAMNDVNMGVSKNRGVSPQIICHYFQHPFFGYIYIFGNTHINDHPVFFLQGKCGYELEVFAFFGAVYIVDLCWIVSLQGLPAPGSVCKGWEVQKLPRIHGHLNQGYLDTLHVAWHWNYIFKELGEEILQLWYHFQMDFLDVFGWMNHEYVQSWEKVVPGCAWWCMGHRDE